MINDRDIITLTGLSERSIQGYKKIYPLMLVHQVAEDALAKTDGRLQKAVIDIPNVGTLVYNKKKGSYKFTPTQVFDKQVRQALEGKSALATATTESLIQRINRQYNELL